MTITQLESATKKATKISNFFDSLHHRRVFGSVPKGPHPLVHHDACVSVDQNPQEEQYDRWDNHHSQRVELVVLRKTRAVKVKAGVELDADQSQDDADPIGDRLGVGLEVLQNYLQTLHVNCPVGAEYARVGEVKEAAAITDKMQKHT